MWLEYLNLFNDSYNLLYKPHFSPIAFSISSHNFLSKLKIMGAFFQDNVV